MHPLVDVDVRLRHELLRQDAGRYRRRPAGRPRRRRLSVRVPAHVRRRLTLGGV